MSKSNARVNGIGNGDGDVLCGDGVGMGKIMGWGENVADFQYGVTL